MAGGVSIIERVIYCSRSDKILLAQREREPMNLFRGWVSRLWHRECIRRFLKRENPFGWKGWFVVRGARSRGRTGTVSLPRDFKSLASTNFAIRAWARMMGFFTCFVKKSLCFVGLLSDFVIMAIGVFLIIHV